MVGGWRWIRTAPAIALTNKDSILVGGFGNTTGDAVFDETIAMALKVQLGQSPFLDIVPDDRMTDELRLMQRPSEERLTHDIAREVCERLGLKAMLDGTLAALGSNYVLTLNATDCHSGATVASEQKEASSKEEVLKVLGPMASSMRTKLGESLPSIKRFDVPIEQATTPSLPALKAYALGIGERRKGREIESIAFFNRAIELDPEFAAAYTTLSTVYGSIGEWRRSEEYAQLAYDRQKRVSERERLFITYQYHDRVTGNQDEAARTLEMWKTAVSARFPPAERALADPQPVRALRQGGRGSHRSASAKPGDRVSHVEPGIRVSWTWPVCGRPQGRRRSRQARGGHGADAPAALPARDHDERRLGGGADRMGEIACRASSI